MDKFGQSPEEKPEFLSEPLMTPEGFLNPACMNELSAAIGGMGKTHERLKGDEEWTEKKWTSRGDIVGSFAKWACRQSPYGVPDGLEDVCKFLNAALVSCADWEAPEGFAECSLCDINRWLYEILYRQGVKVFDAWNVCRKGPSPDILFASAMDGRRDPDRDFIDLDALLHNVCIDIRGERRANAAFDKAFEERWATDPEKGAQL